ncbi:hypothetical protein [Endozoicomonas numazuensis]|uniref:Uncharacterized protein n=1 Tax=Endozoicomonas numazuensis TaxID=1137799 RepID=A0A081NDM0_9GAMM|nr:hypothetical protein [Endozoicomonas numazuensis]KEQ16543.1 hypothetical protein GZ78_22130 [Endozoicomonas numazuensis]
MRFSDLTTGIILFDLSGYQFPSKNWDDFVVTIMGWWLRAIIDLKTGASRKEELYFMDGPYLVTVEKRNTSMCSLFFMERDIAVLKTVDLYPLDDLADSLLSAAQQVYSTCLEHQWQDEDKDVKYLKERIDQLSELYPDLGTECQA